MKVGVDPGAGVEDSGRVVAVAAFPLMFDKGTAVGLVERSETDGPVTVPDDGELAGEPAGELAEEAALTKAGKPATAQDTIKVETFIFVEEGGKKEQR